jgi:hypothetical protein
MLYHGSLSDALDIVSFDTVSSKIFPQTVLSPVLIYIAVQYMSKARDNFASDPHVLLPLNTLNTIIP